MESAITELYRVFKPYRLGEDFTGCEHCVKATDSKLLASIPLRELSVRDLNLYAFKALTTWGTDRHFKYFLPRLLELAFDEYLDFDFPEVLLGKLAHAKWDSWPSSERTAVRDFLQSFWIHQLHFGGDFPVDERIRTVLAGLAETSDSILVYLTVWPDQQAIFPALHLAQLIYDLADQIMTTGVATIRGKPTSHGMELVAWLSSEQPLCLLNTFRDAVIEVFPLVFNHLNGVRAQMATRERQGSTGQQV